MPDELVMRHRTPQFGHIFASDNYSAGYYSYLWAEVIARDAFAAFTEAGSAYDPATAKKLQKTVMSVGNSIILPRLTGTSAAVIQKSIPI